MNEDDLDVRLCCWQCVEDRGVMFPMMILCHLCGNKRCPRATDHTHPCTESNDPGQAGSVYGGHKLRKRDLPT